ncbi:MAG TPA: aspartate kinase [Chloroflexia bacterium]|nr:aspartate kinase [Chloroflexia bacterium]
MPAVVVQKYGGSSVAGVARVQAVAARVAATVATGVQVAVVVSAMGDTTDALIALAQAVHPDPTHRELDLLMSTGEVVACAVLALALQARGVAARALTGAQAGIYTSGPHRRAAIADVDSRRVRAVLAAGEVAIVAGFQGVRGPGPGGEITTLGRGGSDTSAVALAVALGAAWCEIYTDVAGIFTADPRLVPAAQQIPRLGYTEMLELAHEGARVLHPRAVELGSVYGLPIVVRSSFHARPGTVIAAPARRLPPELDAEGIVMELDNKISGVAHDADVARVTVTGVPRANRELHRLFTPLAAAGINVDAIAYALDAEGHAADCTFTVAAGDLARTVQIAGAAAVELGAREVRTRRDVAKVSLIGLGIQDTPGLAAQAFAVLAGAGIPIEMVTTSQIRITCLVPENRLEEAARLLHHAFGLDGLDPPPERPALPESSFPRIASVPEVCPWPG